MMNKFFVILVSLIFSMSTNAQELKHFTLEDLNFGGKNYHKMTTKNRWLTWWGDELVRLDIDKCSIVDKATGKEKVLFTLKDLNKWIESDNATAVHTLYYARFPYTGKSLVMVETNARRILVDFKAHKMVFYQSKADENNTD